MPLDKTNAAALITAIENRALTYQTLEADAKISYQSGGHARYASATIRMDADSAIWFGISFIGIPVARAMVTKDSLFFYERINRTYVRRDLKSIAAVLGASLSLTNLESIFTGKPIITGNTGCYTLKSERGQYRLAHDSKTDSSTVLKGLVSRIRVNGDKTIAEQSLCEADAGPVMRVNYSDYIRVKDKRFPKNIYIKRLGATDPLLIKIEYKNIRVNHPIRMPFHIPEGYEPRILW